MRKSLKTATSISTAIQGRMKLGRMMAMSEKKFEQSLSELEKFQLFELLKTVWGYSSVGISAGAVCGEAVRGLWRKFLALGGCNCRN